MFRIDTPNKAVDLFGAGKHGFRDGDKAAGINATELSAAQQNALQEELAAIIEATSGTLNKANNAQVLAAIQSLITNRNISGLVRSLTPTGGALVREYADIASAATVGGIEIGMSYNCAIDPVTGIWAGRDVADICWLEKWHDTAGMKEFWFAPTAAAGAVPVWVLMFSFNVTTGVVSGVEKSGMVAHFAMSTAPAGWLKANGAAISVASYSALASAIYMGDALNATALSGYKCTDPANPTTTRNIAGTYIVLPDLRGEFLRGWDDARGVDTGRTIGSAQADDFKGHTHTVALLGRVNTYSSSSTVAAESGEASSTSSGTPNTSSAGGVETRPRNIALLACIKY